jgi:MoaA/NifB/PqqE/SkfB family radical SAM enzyme
MADELTLQEARQIIGEMAELGTEVLLFSGGEPLLRKEFVLELAEYWACCLLYSQMASCSAIKLL